MREWLAFMNDASGRQGILQNTGNRRVNPSRIFRLDDHGRNNTLRERHETRSRHDRANYRSGDHQPHWPQLVFLSRIHEKLSERRCQGNNDAEGSPRDQHIAQRIEAQLFENRP